MWVQTRELIIHRTKKKNLYKFHTCNNRNVRQVNWRSLKVRQNCVAVIRQYIFTVESVSAVVVYLYCRYILRILNMHVGGCMCPQSNISEILSNVFLYRSCVAWIMLRLNDFTCSLHMRNIAFCHASELNSTYVNVRVIWCTQSE